MTDAAPIKPLTREDVASLLGVSDKTIDKMVREGSLPRPWQLGSCRRLYWHPDDWNAWIEQHRRPSFASEDSSQDRLTPTPIPSPAASTPSRSKLSELARLTARQTARLATMNGRR